MKQLQIILYCYALILFCSLLMPNKSFASSEIFLNGDFEQGHSLWLEEYLHNGSYFPWDRNIFCDGEGYESSCHAYMEENELLLSSIFKLPVNSQSIDIEAKYRFLTYSSKTMGSYGGINFTLEDYTSGDSWDIYAQNAKTNIFDYNYENITDNINVIGQIGHEYYLKVKSSGDEYADTHKFYLDDISVTVNTSNACIGDTCNVYRFWSDAKQGHFFTQSEAEANGIITNDPSWRYEGVAYGAFNSRITNSTPVYRFWSDKKQHHFYTASISERDFVIANDHSWDYEGTAYYAYASKQANTAAVYRFWSDEKQGHFFTKSSTEKDYIVATYSESVWKYEGVAWYVPE